MFPSLIIQPETQVLATFSGYVLFTLGFLIHRIRATLTTLLLGLILFFPTQTVAFVYVPGGCGTICMSQGRIWGYPVGAFPPPVYMYPYFPPPNLFYPNPYSYFPMLAPWFRSQTNAVPTSIR